MHAVIILIVIHLLPKNATSVPARQLCTMVYQTCFFSLGAFSFGQLHEMIIYLVTSGQLPEMIKSLVTSRTPSSTYKTTFIDPFAPYHNKHTPCEHKVTQYNLFLCLRQFLIGIMCHKTNTTSLNVGATNTQKHYWQEFL